jgi:hypothetical protein
MVKFTPLVGVKKSGRPAGSKNKTSATKNKSHFDLHKIRRTKSVNLTKKGVNLEFS